MDPTIGERAAFTSVLDVATWAGFTDNGSQPAQAFGSLCQALGVLPAAAVRIVGFIPKADFDAIIGTWTIATHPPTPAQRSQAGLFGRACRVTTGTEQSLDEVKVEADRKYNIDLAAAKAAAASSTSSSPGRKFKMGNTIDQMNESEDVRLDSTKIGQYYTTYQNRMGGMPKPDDELTAEQITALHNVVVRDMATPYVDMAVWGPHGYRIQKKLRLRGFKLMPDGQLQQVDVAGPADFEVWSKCWRLFRTGAIMMDILKISTMENYFDKIKDYITKFGPDLWCLIYQAEVRARQEHWERCRRIGAEAHSKATTAGASHEFDPSQPWDWSLQCLIDDDKFWKKEIEDDAVLILAKIKTLGGTVDGDADTGGRKRNRGDGPSSSGGGQGRERSPPAKKRKSHEVDSQGRMVCNRSGVRLCSGFQDGSCTNTGRDNRCGSDRSKSHQCVICLSTEHGADHPTKCSRPAAKMPRMSEKGSGKGGKKGRKRS